MDGATVEPLSLSLGLSFNLAPRQASSSPRARKGPSLRRRRAAAFADKAGNSNPHSAPGNLCEKQALMDGRWRCQSIHRRICTFTWSHRPPYSVMPTSVLVSSWEWIGTAGMWAEQRGYDTDAGCRLQAADCRLQTTLFEIKDEHDRIAEDDGARLTD